ncbi:ATP-dependent DNA helicase PIF1 [Geosmithia morbida]|uniref:ATP-dependent DNA helicase PIF1 n=1 Tax=Geosmithia morbida TaxID=1094350 RepID=A0A9P4YU51_9HYPO|nr:ATP-dependent DNA helicase PIF1 [Geosmithia morbida]KAF4123143.1 ATP-dependent DNA helicase PIF1 [Geosmithia morbida]
MTPGSISLPLGSSSTRRHSLPLLLLLQPTRAYAVQPTPRRRLYPHTAGPAAAAAAAAITTPSSSDVNMLGKAAKAYGANPPPSRPSADSDIRDQFSRPAAAAAAAASARTENEEQQRMLSQKWQRTASWQQQKGGNLASLYSHRDSFRDEQPIRDDSKSNVVDLTMPGADTIPKAQAQPEVFFLEDDFSDDADLDLDFEAPSALPPMPRKAEPAAKENIPPPPPLRSTQEVEWSSSPPSHLQPPKKEDAASAPSLSLKRRSSGEDEGMFKAPPPKKRTLPASFLDPPAGDGPQPPAAKPSVAKTPAHSARKDFLDPSASAIKEQRRLLKNQRQPQEAGGRESRDGSEKDPGPALNAAISLSPEQNMVRDLVVNQQKSVFFTGPAGTGKSVLMKAIIRDLKEKHARAPERVAVTASTGLAACNIGGITLHSFAGIGLGKEPPNILVKKIRRNPKAKNRWLKTEFLIIDEVSMVDGELFDKLSQVGRLIRNNGRPWGGIKLVITGDFFQLPPVPDAGANREVKFAFDATTWSTSVDYTFGLTQVFRQRDPRFAEMLNEMRLGRISTETEQAFRALSRPLKFDDGVEMAQLFPTRAQVEHSNVSRLRALPGEARRFAAADSGDPMVRDKLLQNMMAPPVIELKVGAQVMLIKNFDASLVNGSLGKVIAFSDEKSFEMSMGLGQDDAPDSAALAKARAKLQQFQSASAQGDNKYPVVQFIAVDGSSRTVLCQPEEWKVELPNGEVQAKRTQLPLILAWALSIHKAQGQTLERVAVDLGRVFEKGQAYVALSRAVSQQGLQVLHFNKSKVMAHPRVCEFYKQLPSVEEALASYRPKSSSIGDFITNRKGAA